MAKLCHLLRRLIDEKFHYWQRRSPSAANQKLFFHSSLPNEAVTASTNPNPCYYFFGLCNSIQSLRTVHSSLIIHGFSQDRLCNTKLVSMYGKYGHVDLARSVFDTLSDPDFYIWKTMMRWYFLNSLYSEMMAFDKQTRSIHREVDNVVFSILLKACRELGYLHEGMRLHCQIVKVGNPDSFVYSGLVDMYAKCRELEYARSVFEESDDRSVVSWTSMIAGYAHSNQPQEGLILFNKMRQGLAEANEITIVSVMTGCTNLRFLHQGKWIHGCLIKNGIGLNSHLGTSLIDMYSKCGEIHDARRAFDELSTTELVTWTTMIVCYSQSDYPEESLKLFTDHKWANILPNYVTISSILSACAKMGASKMGRSAHCFEIKLGIQDDVVTNSLIDFYAKCRMNEEAHYVFDTIITKDVVAWNSLISGLAHNGSALEALKLFHQMRMEYLQLDEVTYVSALSASQNLGALEIGSSLHSLVVKNGFLSTNVYVGTALLTFYSKCGDALSARSIFNHMATKNATTWSAMICGHGIHGDIEESLKLLASMIDERVKPNEEVFSGLLSACSHSRMIEHGKRLFFSMTSVHGIVPSLKHYVCMVDLLARAGMLEEALKLIDNLPIQPDASLFGAFLHGCALHSRFDLGTLIIKRMLNVEPKACYYVLLCNLYAADARWAQVVQVRELMKQLGLVKSPGHSLMKINKLCASHFLEEYPIKNLHRSITSNNIQDRELHWTSTGNF